MVYSEWYKENPSNIKVVECTGPFKKYNTQLDGNSTHEATKGWKSTESGENKEEPQGRLAANWVNWQKLSIMR